MTNSIEPNHVLKEAYEDGFKAGFNLSIEAACATIKDAIDRHSLDKKEGKILIAIFQAAKSMSLLNKTAKRASDEYVNVPPLIEKEE